MTTREVLDEEFGYLGGIQGLVGAVKKISNKHSGLHESALALFDSWSNLFEDAKANKLLLPPPIYIPHLALLCAAWSIDSSSLDEHEYYKRLGIIYPDHGLCSAKLGKWSILWEGLENWTRELNGTRGIWIRECIGHNLVGIPRSQVILTPAQIKHLPSLVRLTGLDALAEQFPKIPIERVKTCLLNKESYTSRAIGNYLTNEVRKNTQTGRATLDRIIEFLNDPVFLDKQEESGLDYNRSGNSGRFERRIVLRMFIRPTPCNNSWECTLGAIGDDIRPSDEYDHFQWRFLLLSDFDNAIYLLADNAGPINSAELPSLSRGFRQKVYGRRSESAEPDTLILKPREIRLFPATWEDSYLIEDYYLPTDLGCYLLVNEEKQKDVKAWITKFEEQGGIINDFTMPGLPQGCSFFFLDNLSKCNPVLLNDFPCQVNKRKRNRCISTIGGSQSQSGGMRKVYFRYDPPNVILRAHEDVILKSIGAKLEEIKAGTIPSERSYPGIISREFALSIESLTTCVLVDAVDSRSNTTIGNVIFSIANDQFQVEFSNNQKRPFFDRFGNSDNKNGIKGIVIKQDDIENKTMRYSWNLSQGIKLPGYDKNALEEPTWNLLEAISQTTRVSGKEFRRRAVKILGGDDPYFWMNAKWLRALGHIEIERDNKGRIAYIYPSRPFGYMLPWKEGKRWLFAISGCPTNIQLSNLVSNCQQLDCDLHSASRGHYLLPGFLVISSVDIDAVRLALDTADFDYPNNSGNVPLSWEIANWAPSIDDWLAQLKWLEGDPQVEGLVFCPYRFKLASAFSCPYKLHSIEDSYSPKNKWHLLSRSIEPGYVFLREPSWAKWKSVYAATDDPGNTVPIDPDKIPLPYSSQKNELYVPATLRFPSMLTRALLMCSSFPPSIERSLSFYNTPGSIFLPNPNIPYSGACHVYQSIPHDVAKCICAKVNATPVDISNIPFIQEQYIHHEESNLYPQLN